MPPHGRHDDETLEALLRAARPTPSDAFVDATEERLLGRRRHRASRPLIAALGLGGALAATIVGATLVGSGPLGSTDDKAKADQDCRTVTVTTPRRTGELVRTKDGQVRVVTRVRPVTRTVTRCDR